MPMRWRRREYAAASADDAATLELARAFVAGGREAVDETVREWAREHEDRTVGPIEPGAPPLPQVGVIEEAGDGARLRPPPGPARTCAASPSRASADATGLHGSPDGASALPASVALRGSLAYPSFRQGLPYMFGGP